MQLLACPEPCQMPSSVPMFQSFSRHWSAAWVCGFSFPGVAPTWVAEEGALRLYPLERTVTSLVLWLMSWVTWWVSGMSTHGLTGTSMSLSSERTYSKVKSHFWLFLAFGWVETFLATLVENAGGLWVEVEKKKYCYSLSRIGVKIAIWIDILDVQLELLEHRSISISF